MLAQPHSSRLQKETKPALASGLSFRKFSTASNCVPILLDQINTAVRVVDSAWTPEYIENTVEIKLDSHLNLRMANRSSTSVVADPVLSFLRLVSELHEAAVSIHNDHQNWDCDISRLFSTLTTTVEWLSDETGRGDDADVLIRTCVKVGRGLLVRLDRVQAFLKSSGPGADLRIVWPAAAVDALGDRFRDLHHRWSISK